MNDSTLKNIDRVGAIVDGSFGLCACCNRPLPSWVEVSLIDYCTRKCKFCPKSNAAIAPDQKHLRMPPGLVEKISSDLSAMKFAGAVVLAGYGEPLASPYIVESVSILSRSARVEIVTNGDLLTAVLLGKLFDAGVSYVSVSVYDKRLMGRLMRAFTEAGVPSESYVLRDRWHGALDDFGVKLTNRAGTVDVGNQRPVPKDGRCFYVHYSMMIDWNGDALLCPQDWNRRAKCGNVAVSSVHDVWMSEYSCSLRARLSAGDRSSLPCSECNCEGTFHGRLHADGWAAGRRQSIV